MKRFAKFLLIFIAWVGLSDSASALVNEVQTIKDRVIYFDELKGPLNLSPYLDVTKAWQGIFSEEIPNDLFFYPNKDRVPSFGFNKKVWVHFSIFNSQEVEQTLYLEHLYTHTDYIFLLYQEAEGQLVSVMQGDQVSFSERVDAHPTPLFELILKPGINEFYVYAKTQESLVLPLWLLKEKSQSQFPMKMTFLGLVLLWLLAGLCLVIGYQKKELYFIYTGLFALFYVSHHMITDGILAHFFPIVDWSWWMNPGHLILGVLHQLCLFFALTSLMGLSNQFMFQKISWCFKLAAIGLIVLLLQSLFFDSAIYSQTVQPFYLYGFAMILVAAFILAQNLRRHKSLVLIYVGSWSLGIFTFLKYLIGYAMKSYQFSNLFLWSAAFHLLIVLLLKDQLSANNQKIAGKKLTP